MGTLSISLGGNAKTPLERTCEPTRTDVRAKKLTAAVMRAAHRLSWVRKTLAFKANCSTRTIDNWRSGAREIGVEELLSLMETKEGPLFLEAFWACVPKATRDHWIKGEILRWRLAERASERERADVEIEQLRMELSER